MSKMNNNTNTANSISMPPLIDGKVPMLALFERQDYTDLKNNKAMDRNGIRHREGNYWSRQPEHRDLPPELCEAITRQQNHSSRAAEVPAQASHQNLTSRTAETVSRTYSSTREQSGMGLGKVACGIVGRYIIIPVLNQVADRYIIPFLSEKIGGFFCWITGWKNPEADTTEFKDVDDSCAVSAENLHGNGDDCQTDPRPSDDIEETTQEGSMPLKAEKIIRFPA